jgi:DNA-binding NtrC family response regulator
MAPCDIASPNDTIILVHDDVLVRMKLSAFLRDCGYRVLEVSGADEALIVLQQPDIKVDIVFSDVEMPGALDGFGLSTWIRRNRPELGVILAGSIPRSVNAASELCEAQALPRPYQAQGLLDQIKQLVAARRARQEG